MEHQRTAASFFKTTLGIGATLAAVAASAYLYLVHQDHVLALLPYLVLAACPLLHVFMHRGHGHGGHSHHQGGRDGDRRA